MPGGAWIGELIAAVVYLIVGLRLGRLASRTGERPERLLSRMFIWTGISYLLYLVPLMVPIEALWTPFNFAGRVVYVPAPIFVALFTREVFRRSGRISAWLVYATCVLLIAGVGASAMTGDLEGFTLSNPFFWLEWAGYTIPFAWAGLEAFGEYRSSRRRLRLDLCDRMVCNRLLLWSLFGLVQVALSIVMLQMYADFEVNNAFSAFFDGLTGGLELVCIALIWIAFFPPRFYQRFISGADARGQGAGEP